MNLTVERTCTRCHAPAAAVELEGEGIGPSFATITTATTKERTIYGPYQDPRGDFMRTVTNYKFPTGYPSRRAFLHVVVTAPDGRIVFESGKTDGFGRLVTSKGALAEPSTFFPHVDVVEREEQVQVYESVPVRWSPSSSSSRSRAPRASMRWRRGRRPWGESSSRSRRRPADAGARRARRSPRAVSSREAESRRRASAP